MHGYPVSFFRFAQIGLCMQYYLPYPGLGENCMRKKMSSLTDSCQQSGTTLCMYIDIEEITFSSHSIVKSCDLTMQDRELIQN